MPVQQLDITGNGVRRNIPDEGCNLRGQIFVFDFVLQQKFDAIHHIGITGEAQFLAKADDGSGENVILGGKFPNAALLSAADVTQQRGQHLLLAFAQMVLLGQFVQIVFHSGTLYLNQEDSGFLSVYDDTMLLTSGIPQKIAKR